MLEKISKLFENLFSSSSSQKDKTMQNQDKESKEPICVFGVLSDIQYADCPDRSHSLTRSRYYRNSLKLMREAIHDWLKQGERLAFVLQLGDIVDSKSLKTGESEKALKTVITQYYSCFDSNNHRRVPLYHIWGNHEMYNFDRAWLVNTILNTAKTLGQNENTNANYYRHDITDKLTLISLDFYKFSILGYDRKDQECIQAYLFMRK